MFNTDWNSLSLNDEIAELEAMLEVAMSGKGDRTKLEAWWAMRQRKMQIFEVGDKVFCKYTFPGEICEIKGFDGEEYLVKTPNDDSLRVAKPEFLDLVK